MPYVGTISRAVLDDLCSRFIINVPEDERKDLIRICFQVELAHWFYLDFYSLDPTVRKCGLKEFSQNIFHHVPFLQPFTNELDNVIDEWREYKFQVPTFGAILLDEDYTHVLLVQSYYSSWGFPKGKVNKDETPLCCAVREVLEETGFNIRDLINPNEYLDAHIHDQQVRLYIIPGVSKDVKFEPKTRNEIKAIEWFPMNEVPASKKDPINRSKDSFFMVIPFIRRLRQWIFEHKGKPIKKSRPRHNSCGDMENNRIIGFRKKVDSLSTESMDSDDKNNQLSSAKKKLKKREKNPKQEIVGTRDQNYVVFNQIELSEPFKKYGITSWLDFKIDKSKLFV